ncbi:hypothetical protein DFJ77DRAFT_466811 [Powellomyces hirtus]|nr:hypothetical protein DFJ77DRAFT_466811 [Powellomyces hirtus]
MQGKPSSPLRTGMSRPHREQDNSDKMDVDDDSDQRHTSPSTRASSKTTPKGSPKRGASEQQNDERRAPPTFVYPATTSGPTDTPAPILPPIQKPRSNNIPFPCFWTFLSFRSLRFLHIPTLLKTQLANSARGSADSKYSPATAMGAADTILGQSLFDYLHPADAQVLQRDFRTFMDLQTLQGSIIRCRMKHLFSGESQPRQPVPSTKNEHQRRNSYHHDQHHPPHVFPPCEDRHFEYPHIGHHPPFSRDEDYMLVDIGMNPINEECVLAFFHIGADDGGPACSHPFSGETHRWTSPDVAALGYGLQNSLKTADTLDRGVLTSRAVDVRRDAAATTTRFVQILDAEDLSLLFVYPKERFTEVLDIDGQGSTDTSDDETSDGDGENPLRRHGAHHQHHQQQTGAPTRLEQSMHPDDFARFRKELTRRDTPSSSSSSSRSTSHQPKRRRRLSRSNTISPAQSPSENAAVKREADSDDEPDPAKQQLCTKRLFYMPHRLRLASSLMSATPRYIDAETVVVPYGKVLFLITQALGPLFHLNYSTGKAVLMPNRTYAARQHQQQQQQRQSLLDDPRQVADAWNETGRPLRPTSASPTSHLHPLVPFRPTYDVPRPLHVSSSFPYRSPSHPYPHPHEMDEVTRRWVHDNNEYHRRAWHAAAHTAAANGAPPPPPPPPRLDDSMRYAPPPAPPRPSWPPAIDRPHLHLPLPVPQHHTTQHHPYPDYDHQYPSAPRGYDDMMMMMTMDSSSDDSHTPTSSRSTSPHTRRRPRYHSRPSPPSDPTAPAAETPSHDHHHPQHLHNTYPPPTPYERIGIKRELHYHPQQQQQQHGTPPQLPHLHHALPPHILNAPPPPHHHPHHHHHHHHSSGTSLSQPKLCESCLTTESPEWRKGPSGLKTLCNACGLRYSRSVAKLRSSSISSTPGGGGVSPYSSNTHRPYAPASSHTSPSPLLAPHSSSYRRHSNPHLMLHAADHPHPHRTSPASHHLRQPHTALLLHQHIQMQHAATAAAAAAVDQREP